MKAFPTFISPETGKQQYKIVPYETNHIYFDGSKFVGRYDKPLGGTSAITDFVEIPCGQCIGCRLERSRQWANRCLLELQDHPEHPGYFVTLTYDDYHLPRSWYGDPHTGLASQAFSLCKRDFQLFFKRLRKVTGQEIRYFGCGEYGPTTFRPHGHFDIFGLHLDDLTPLPGRSELGYQYYNSPTLDRVWSFPMRDEFGNPMEDKPSLAGFAVIGEITWETCAYTARYITKKLTGPEAQYYQFFNIEPPFSMMSLKPGIGRMYYDQHPDLYDHEYIHISTDKGGRKFRPPRYFDRLFDIDHPEESAQMKAFRKSAAEETKRLKLQSTGLDYLSMLQVQEDSLNGRIKSLLRNKN